MGFSKRAFGAGMSVALAASLVGGAVSAQDPVVMLSTQLVPEEEAAKMRDNILAGFEGVVDFVGSEGGPFIDTIRSEAQAGSGDVGVAAGLHGELSTLGAEGLLTDLSDLVAELDVAPAFLELGKLGTDQQLYIPWMQATYIMAARTDALEYLPDGSDINALTWEEVTQWGANLLEGTGERLLGFPFGEDGLRHRLLQGYLYPSFTGRVNNEFATQPGVDMWNWLVDTWQYVNPQSTTYGFMQEPLQSGEVGVAWDHTARLIDALNADPEGFVAFPSPAGPGGRAFMPVIIGLAVPVTAPDPEGAKDVIRHLLKPETQGITLEQVSFFPVLAGDVPANVGPGVQAQLDAISAQTGAADALPALLPIGLGDQGGAYSGVFQDALTQIVIDGRDPAEVLAALAPTLQEIFDTTGAPCWEPDEVTDDPCLVGVPE
ncbi:MAG: ABC transporter substrate-binding protein [Candidatus Limnocylindrales bacterium]